MQFEVLYPGQYAVPQLLDVNGIIQLLPASVYDTFDRQGLRLFCHNHARYGLPTQELVVWLRDYISSRSVIEIGAGSGDLSYHLRAGGMAIRATDNCMQRWEEVRLQYELTGQPVIQYPKWVEQVDAVHAVMKHKPEVVLASWVTEWIDPSLPMPGHGGNPFGVKESFILDTGVTYILIGNDAVHGKKEIMKRKHERFYFPFIRSRAKQPNLNCVYVWHGK